MFKRKITRKLTLLVSVILIFFMAVVIAAQFFVVGRTAMTTDETKRRTNALTLEAMRFAEEYYDAVSRRKFEDLKEPLGRIARDNQASCFILDGTKFDVMVFSENVAQMNFGHVLSMQGIVGRIYSSSELSLGQTFRVEGFFGLPTRYVGICHPLSIETSNSVTSDHYYLVFVTREVYARENYETLLRYCVVLFVIVACISVALAFAFSAFVTWPILQMKDAAAYMTRLDFSHPCGYRAADELGELSSSLNFLSESLADTIGKLHAANSKLQEDLDLQQEIDRMRKEFVSSVSHEFKTPLTLLRGYVEMMEEGRLPAAELQNAQKTMIAEIDKLDRMVLELLDLSRLESGLYEPERKHFDIHALLREIAQKCALMFQEKEISLRLECADGPMEVLADPVRIEQVIVNFLSNAIKNTKRGGKVVLSSEREGADARISVWNEGEPVKEEDLAHIWDPFYMADRSRSRKTGGTGLGLSICREIFIRHGSRFGVENVSGGVKFLFIL